MATRAVRPMPMHPLLGWHVIGTSQHHLPSVLDSGSHVLTRSARSALALALREEGIGAGDRVLLPNYYCPTMPAPVEWCGATPSFYPIRPNAEPDLEWLEASMEPTCRALVVAHFFGLPIPLGALRELCDRKRILLIEDCAHAFFGSVEGRPVGSVGDYAIASLPKFFPVVEGGLLVSRDRKVGSADLAPARLLAEVKAAWNLMEAASLHDRLPGINAPINVAAAALSFLRRRRQADAVEQPEAESAELVRRVALADPLLKPQRLRRIEGWLLRRAHRSRIGIERRRNYLRLVERLAGASSQRALFPDLPVTAVPYVFPVWLQDPDAAYAMARARGLPVLRWDRYWPGANTAPSDIGRNWGHHVVQVLCHQDLSAEDIDHIASELIDIAR